MDYSMTFTFGGRAVKRIGYGAMQLAGPGVMGPPSDRNAALAVLREAVASGINHIDTSDFYGPHITNQLIHEALAPYPDDLRLVTKIGARRDKDGAWLPASTPDALEQQVYDNLRHLGLDTLDVVNLRIMFDAHGPAEAQRLVDIVCVQNHYNLAHRHDDALIDALARDGIAYVPFFPLGGFNPLQSAELDDVANKRAATPMQVALAWLLQRSPNILLIPGTSSVAHLHDNIASANLQLGESELARLDAVS